MAFPTTGDPSELHAVNQILASVGQAPVTTLDQTNPDVAICYMTLMDTNRHVQAEGWTFNKEFDYPMQVNETTRRLTIPNNMLQVDLSTNKKWLYGGYSSVRRTYQETGEHCLYERNNHTYEWKDDTLYCDVVWLWDWKDLPIPIQEYIVSKSAVIVSQRIVTDPNLFAMLQEQEKYSRDQAIEYECNQGDYTYYGHPQGRDYYNSYQPFQVLYR